MAELPTASGATAEIHYFLVHEEHRGDAQEGREREWLPYEHARRRLTAASMQRMLDAAAANLGLV
jgi:hypothetical protein